MNEFDLVANHLGNHADVANTASARAVTFEENEVAGLGFSFVDGVAYVALGGTGMGEVDTKLAKTEAGEPRTIEPLWACATGAVANVEMPLSEMDNVANDWNLFVKGGRFGRCYGGYGPSLNGAERDCNECRQEHFLNHVS